MAETTTASTETESAASAETPALTEDRIADIVAKAFDARIPGLMSANDQKFNSLQEEVRKATLTEDEVETEREQSEAEELQTLRRENAMLSAGADMPAAVKVYQELNAKTTGKEQLEFIQSLIDNASPGNAASGDGADEEEEEDNTAPVDSNRIGGGPSPMSD